MTEPIRVLIADDQRLFAELEGVGVPAEFTKNVPAGTFRQFGIFLVMNARGTQPKS